MDDLSLLLEQLRQERNAGLTFEELMARLNDYSNRFDMLQTQWITHIRAGGPLEVEEMAKRIGQEMNLRRQNHEHISPKRLNPLYILSLFAEKLNLVKYEQDICAIGTPEDACHCQLRMSHHLPPIGAYLEKIGVSQEWSGDDIDIFSCSRCATGWVKEDVGGGGVQIDQWKEWDQKEYPLKRA
ncbi:MAG: hypothetical protein AAF587_42540 [Bacteroidota bacterium]